MSGLNSQLKNKYFHMKLFIFSQFNHFTRSGGEEDLKDERPSIQFSKRRRHRHNHRGDGYEEENQIEKIKKINNVKEDDHEKGKKRAILYFLSPLVNRFKPV